MSDSSEDSISDSETMARSRTDILDLFASDNNEESFSGFTATDENNNVEKHSANLAGPSSTVRSNSTGPGKGPGKNTKGKAPMKRKSSTLSSSKNTLRATSIAKKFCLKPDAVQELLDLCDILDLPEAEAEPKESNISTIANNIIDKPSTSNDTSCTPSTSSNTLESLVDLDEGRNIISNSSSATTSSANNDNESFDFPQIFTEDITFAAPVQENMAAFVEKCCTKQADIKKYIDSKGIQIPRNTQHLVPRRLAPEIFQDLPPASRAGDSAVQDVQKLIGLGVSPLLNLVQMFNTNNFDVNTVQEKLLHSITILCNAHFELSIRRRYLLKRFLKKRYQQLCLPSNPVGETLFGSELTQRLKDIGESQKIMENFNRSYGPGNSSFGRGKDSKNFRRGHPRNGPGRRNRGQDRGRRPPRRGNFSSY